MVVPPAVSSAHLAMPMPIPALRSKLKPKPKTRRMRRMSMGSMTSAAPPPRVDANERKPQGHGLLFRKVPQRAPGRRMQWPTSPVRFGKKGGPPPRVPHTPIRVVEDQRGNGSDSLSAHKPRSKTDTSAPPPMTQLEDPGQPSALPLGTIDLSALRITVQSVGLPRSPSSRPSETEDQVLDELSLLRMSLEEELEEFRQDPDTLIKMFPEYFSDHEKQLIKEIADHLALGCHISEAACVFKMGSTLDRRSGPASRAVLSRVKSLPEPITSENVFVDVPSFAQHGQADFLARLDLRRLNSGGGFRQRMLWDVARLNAADRIADPITEGQGGVYAVQSRASGARLAMFKPAEEEKFVREGINPGEGAVREEAAYVLDSRSKGFSGVPPTAAARVQLHNADCAKNGAVQRFMKGAMGSMESYGMPLDLSLAEAFVPVEQVHRIALLDIRTFNTDRHPGNILLIGDKAPFTMVPIDHGCILPSWFHLSEARFDWLMYPQCHVPLSARSIAYIEALDADADAAALRKLGIREECVTTSKICTLFLKLAARHNHSLHWMGTFMQRAGCFENPSQMELAIARACSKIGIPFSFVPNEFGEHKSLLPLGALSRRPPRRFFQQLEELLEELVRPDGAHPDCPDPERLDPDGRQSD